MNAEKRNKEQLKSVGQRIRKCQRFKKIYDQEIASKINISVRTHRSYLQGNSPMPLDILIKVAYHLHLNMNYIIYGIEEEHMYLSKKEIENSAVPNYEKAKMTFVASIKSMDGFQKKMVIQDLLIILTDIVDHSSFNEE